MKIFPILEENSWKIEIKLFRLYPHFTRKLELAPDIPRSIANPPAQAVTKKKTAIIPDYAELKKEANREVSMVAYPFRVSKEMVSALNLLTH